MTGFYYVHRAQVHPHDLASYPHLENPHPVTVTFHSVIPQPLAATNAFSDSVNFSVTDIFIFYFFCIGVELETSCTLRMHSTATEQCLWPLNIYTSEIMSYMMA